MKLSELLAIEDHTEFWNAALEHSVDAIGELEDRLKSILRSGLDDRLVMVFGVVAYNLLQFVIRSVLAGEEKNEYAVYEFLCGTIGNAYIMGQIGASNLIKSLEEDNHEAI